MGLELHRKYRVAFAEYAERVRHARALMSARKADRQAIDAALLEMEKARLNYNRQRDVLAEQLMTKKAGVRMPAESGQRRGDRVEEIAHLRWELAGKPEGTAEDDWYRAEEIVRTVNAA